MTEYHWLETRERAVELFGEGPSAPLEEDIRSYFAERPAHVAQLIERIGAKVQTGKIRSGWGVLRKELNSTPADDITATDEADRDKRIRSAKQWIENAGLYYDLQRHIEAELFGDDHARGRLDSIDLTDTQRQDLIDHWRQHRPRGEKAEAAAHEWQTRPDSRQRVREILARKKAEFDAAQAEPEPVAATADPDDDIPW